MMKLSRALTVFMLFCVTAAYAQQPAASPVAKPAVSPVASSAGGAPAPVQGTGLTPEEMNKPFNGSFFLSPLEIAAIQQALAGHLLNAQTLGDENAPPPPHRVIRISGVFYRTPRDWIVWMNNQKVTPDNLLPEIVDISVRDSSKVSLKWYDASQNQVISITLRPQQVYDITTGILLPGSGQ